MKINYKELVIMIISLLSNFIVLGQQNIGLSVGDSLPIFSIPKMIHSKNRVESTSDYKNKLLIIDFWGTGCGTCIESLPKMEALEKKFNGMLRILPVTDEKEKNILEFWNNNKYTRDLKGASVVEDRIFKEYFKHKYIPHEVWVYKGKIIAITSLEYIDTFNINKVLKGDVINWPIKNDFYSFDRDKPLFELDKKMLNIESDFVSYSAISDFREKNNSPIWFSGGSGIQRDTIKKTIRSFFLNQPILNSYLMYLPKIINSEILVKPRYAGFLPNQVVWEVNDKSKYIFEKKLGLYSQEWLLRNGICFESLYPDTGQNDKEVAQSVISDLDRLLGLKVRWEKRTETVLLITAHANKKNKILKVTKDGKLYSIYDIYHYLNEQADNPYVFNESGDELTEILLNIKSWKDILNIKKGLQNAGFNLQEQSREVDKLVFTEIDGGRIIDSDLQSQEKKRENGQDTLKKVSQEENGRFIEKNKNYLGVNQMKSGLQYKVICEGKGMKPLFNSRVIVHYEGKLVNGKIFNSSYKLGLPVELKVNEVIKGWSEALQLMKEGSEWELYIPSSLAYGSHTAHGMVPSNSTLIFRVKLIRIIQP